VGRETPGRVRFIHLNHTNPALNDQDLQDTIRARGFPVAEVGERVAI
jgi:phosphoribosyl 1,2-cyclic phosphodiesterase